MKSLSIFGTASNSGKSSITLALCKIFSNLGYKVAPFKAQNMSNNSAVCDDGSEIGRAQYLQAESIPIETSYHLNPILLKPQGNAVSQVIINGKVAYSASARDYYNKIESLKPYVISAFESLHQNRDFLIAEGAGSPVELNLLKKDLSNSFVATHFNTKIILVADIDRGGVFASIFGTYELLCDQMKQNVIGVIINKFMGDIGLFDEGIEIIESRFHLPVLGIIPYTPLNIDMEDSMSINAYQKNNREVKIKIALIQLPKISNYNDIDPLIADSEVMVERITTYKPLGEYDLIILPGSKTTINDLRWLKEVGLFDEIVICKRNYNTPPFLFGICGGYQMMFNTLDDSKGVENEEGTIEKGFGFIDSVVTYSHEKRVTKGIYTLFGEKVKGYEIHSGRIDAFEIGYEKQTIHGTHLHGIFENDTFRTNYLRSISPDYKGYKSYQSYKDQQINNFTDVVHSHLNIEKIIQAIET